MSRSIVSPLTVWQPSVTDALPPDAAHVWRPLSVVDAVQLDASECVSMEPRAEPSATPGVVLQPLSALRFIGALLVVDGRSQRVSLNGVPLATGLHLVRHADWIDIGKQTFWVSSAATVIETSYDPALDGDEVFCFMTKARLSPGSPIKICPGVPGTACGVIYKSAAWDMAMQSMKCPNCGYQPGQAEWQPPSPKTRGSLDALLPLITH